jgi:hypothetical protein
MLEHMVPIVLEHIISVMLEHRICIMLEHICAAMQPWAVDCGLWAVGSGLGSSTPQQHNLFCATVQPLPLSKHFFCHVLLSSISLSLLLQ